MTRAKAFKLGKEEILRLAPGFGGCFATDEITVHGARVGYMYRESPDFPEDSGWRFLAGSESAEYLDDPDNTSIFDVNTIANHDPEIIPLLSAPVGSAFQREDGDGPLRPCEGPDDADTEPSQDAEVWPPPGVPLVKGVLRMTDAWSITLPDEFCRRTEDGSLVLWRPGMTLWISAWGNDNGETQAARLAKRRRDLAPGSKIVREGVDGPVTRLHYRLREGGDECFMAAVWSDTGYLLVAIYFEDCDDESLAARLADSLKLTVA